MLFHEFRFFVFLAIVLVGAWSLRRNRDRKLFLLAGSYAFYGAWDWRFLALIWISTVVDYGVGRALETARGVKRLRLLQLSLFVNLGLLAVFKYFGFFADSLVELLGRLGLTVSEVTVSIVLPVGISFYTFQTLSYTIDVYRGRLEATRSALDFALFVAFFPQLVAGPIVRARDFLPQLLQTPRWSDVQVRSSLWLFIVGFFKKACVADNLGVYVDAFFRAPEQFDMLSAWLAVVSYSVQIYCDFSGYSDMAIGCAGLLGYQLCVNFRHPYFATRLADFWRRWHISLSTWLRDYLYIPLGGNRGSAWSVRKNLLITMTLGGLWHGAAWTYVVWGACHGVYLVVEMEVAKRLGISSPRSFFGKALGWFLTFGFLNVTWLLFRATDLAASRQLASVFFGLSGSAGSSLPLKVLFVILLLALLHAFTSSERRLERWLRMPAPAFALAWGAFFALCLSLVPTGRIPFIYFQF